MKTRNLITICACLILSLTLLTACTRNDATTDDSIGTEVVPDTNVDNEDDMMPDVTPDDIEDHTMDDLNNDMDHTADDLDHDGSNMLEDAGDAIKDTVDDIGDNVEDMIYQ